MRERGVKGTVREIISLGFYASKILQYVGACVCSLVCHKSLPMLP
jgi:hypothetical protein